MVKNKRGLSILSVVVEPVAKVLHRRRWRTLLLYTRAWRKIQETGGQPLAHFELASVLDTATVKPGSLLRRLLVPGVSDENVELTLRQRLLKDLVVNKLMPRFMMHKAFPERAQSFGLPPSWRTILLVAGVNVAPLGSRLDWTLYLLQALVRAAKTIRRLALNNMNIPEAPTEPYAVLVDLTLDAATIRGRNDKAMHNFASWYSDGALRKPEEIHVWSQTQIDRFHTIQAGYGLSPAIFPKLGSTSERLGFALKALGRFGLACSMTLFGRWQAALLADESVYLSYCRYLGVEGLATTYVYHNSNWIYRPLWTYYAEQQGSRVIMAFYSANITPIYWRDGTQTPYYPGYRIMNWPQYALWDKGQENFVRSVALGDPVTHIVGAIPYADADTPMPDIPSRSIGLFDVSIGRPALLANLGIISPYYSSDVMRRFLFDSYEACAVNGRTLVLKRKRDIGRLVDRDYAAAVEELSRMDGVLILDPDINAARLIAEVEGVISIPYTSTAILAKLATVPSVYYDPMAVLRTEGPECHGIAMLDSSEELTAWVARLDAPPARDGSVLAGGSYRDTNS